MTELSLSRMLLIANRGEIAIRIARAAADVGVECASCAAVMTSLTRMPEQHRRHWQHSAAGRRTSNIICRPFVILKYKSLATVAARLRISASGNAASSADTRSLLRSPRPPACRRVSASGSLTPHYRSLVSVRYDNVGTVEFLVDAEAPLEKDSQFAFIETNARLQVEHTVTEEVTGFDIVEAQLRLASGATLAEIGLGDGATIKPRGFSIQARINLETFQPDGSTIGTGGILSVYELPSGKGLRVDGFGYAGYRTNPAFDPLLAKLIVHHPSGAFADAAAKLKRALGEIRIEGAETNVGVLHGIATEPAFVAGEFRTAFLQDHLASILERAAASDGGRSASGRRAAKPRVA